MNKADYFRNEWWDMVGSSRNKEREKQLSKEHLEVADEIMRQEYCDGKTKYALAEEYGLHIVTIYRIIKRADARNK